MAKNNKKNEEKNQEPIVNDEVLEAAKKDKPGANEPVQSVNLKIEIGFNDKYTDVEYEVGKVIPFEEKRAAELLADPRKLVSKA